MPPIPPIPIHSNDPISPETAPSSSSDPKAAKPDGITPQTSAANPTPTRTIPASIPAITTQDPTLPPAPQPGARPVPQPTSSVAGNLPPPPPQPSITATHTTLETRVQPTEMPAQFNVPPPNDARLAGRSTSTTNTGRNNGALGPTTLNLGPATSPYQQEASATATEEGGERRSLEHPPGYVQNPDPAKYATYTPSVGNETGGGEGAGQGTLGGAAWNLLSRAGEALKKGEEAAWKAARSK